MPIVADKSKNDIADLGINKISFAEGVSSTNAEIDQDHTSEHPLVKNFILNKL